MLRASILLLLFIFSLTGCGSSGTHVGDADGAAADAAQDVTTEGASGDDGPAAGTDAGDAGLMPCAQLPLGNVPSDDCVFVGACPLDCLSRTASEYACSAQHGDIDASLAEFPSVFTVPAGTVTAIQFVTGMYPWQAEAGVFLSCAPLSCVRWATADHVDGGSSWPNDPCAGSGNAVQAWTCPPSPGVVPPLAGCVNAGDTQTIGGPEAGTALDSVWCCPPAVADGGADAGTETDAGNDAGDAAPIDAGAADASAD